MSEEMFYDFERSQEYAIDVLIITEIIRTVEITIVPIM